MSERCATRSYLQMAASERPWTGKPSTTQLINGTMLAFLRLTKDYAISPQDVAFRVLGSKGHGALESAEDEYSTLEERFEGPDVDETGITDVVEIEDSIPTMADYKTSGSYKVAKALGFTTKQEPTGEIYKSGKRKGEPRMRQVLVRNEESVDMWEWIYQLNKYRIEWEKKHQRKIKRLKIQAIVRDGGLYIARSRGVFRNVYYFDVPILPDDEVLWYFKYKRERLLKALKQGYWHQTCNRKENWDGLRCQKYCEVAEFCPYGKYLKQEKEKEEMAIKGLSEIKRLPRLGKIRLGIKVPTGNGKERPKEVDYFILDPATPNEEERQRMIQEFHKLYGEKPKRFDFMLPTGNPDIDFPQFYKRYGSSASLKCKGDGETAICSDPKFTEELEVIEDKPNPKVKCAGKECPYYKAKECSEVGTLNVLIPQLPGVGVWQINTGSYHSIVNLNSCMGYVKAVCGRCHMIPLTLERHKHETVFKDSKGNQAKSNHYILHITGDFRLADIQKVANIAPEKVLLDLPDVDPEKEDLLFLTNERINADSTKVETSQPKEAPPQEEALYIEYKEWLENDAKTKERMAEWWHEVKNAKTELKQYYAKLVDQRNDLIKQRGWDV